MTTKTYSTTTKEVTAEQLWKLMSNVDGWKRWDAGTEDSKLNGAFATGSSFMLKPKGGPKLTIELLEVKAPTYFKDVTKFPLAKMYDEHSYEQTADGLKITSTLTMTGPLGFFWNMVVMKNIVENLPKDIATQIAEAKNL